MSNLTYHSRDKLENPTTVTWTDMLSDILAAAEEAEKNYRWTKRLMTTVYRDPKPERPRKVVAHLFVGEWTRYLKDAGEELRIRFRGGEGYVPRDRIGNERVLEIYFLDVGQGDSILIQTPDDKRVLIDGGENKSAHSFLQWKYNLRKYHKDFDAVIMTHGDADHAGGLIRILNDNHVAVRAIYHNGIAKHTDGSLGRVTSDEEGDMLVDLYNDIEDLKPRYNRLNKIYKDWVDVLEKVKNGLSDTISTSSVVVSTRTRGRSQSAASRLRSSLP